MSSLLSLWLVWCLLGGVSLVFAVKSMITWILTPTAEEGEPDVDLMEGKAFEVYVAGLLEDQGYQVQLTQDGPDYGADVILQRENTRKAVQVKRYSGSVGVEAIQQVVAAKAVYGCSEAKVVTNNFYTQSAQYLARMNGVELWDRPILLRAIAARHARRRDARVQARAFHRLSSLTALVIAGVLVGVGLIGFWQQGSSGWKLELANQPIANNTLHLAVDPEPGAASEILEPTDRNTAVEGFTSEESCGSAIVQIVAALAIRQAPSLQSDAVGEVPQGRAITLVCAPPVAADGITWQRVDYGSGYGWMSRKYLLVEQP